MNAKQRTVIVTDSTCDLSTEILDKYNIIQVPLYVTLGDKTFRDGVDTTPQMLYSYVGKSGNLPKTSAPSPQDYREVFEELTNANYEVVCLTIGSDFSCSCCNAKISAEEFKNVFVVDSQNLSAGVGYLVLDAAELSQCGKSAKEIYDELTDKVPYIDTSFVIEKLEYLYKGGRCNAAAMFGANLLHIKPCIQVKNGKMNVGKKYRGSLKSSVSAYIKDKLSDIEDIDQKRIFITHTMQHDPKLVEYAIEIVKSIADFDQIIETKAGSTISSHCGPGTLGVLFGRKTPLIK